MDIYIYTQYNNIPQSSREGDLIQERTEKMERWRRFMIEHERWNRPERMRRMRRRAKKRRSGGGEL